MGREQKTGHPSEFVRNNPTEGCIIGRKRKTADASEWIGNNHIHPIEWDDHIDKFRTNDLSDDSSLDSSSEAEEDMLLQTGAVEASIKNIESEGGGRKDGGVMIATNAKVLNDVNEAYFAQVMEAIVGNGDLQQLSIPYYKAYLRKHGLRLSGTKRELLDRINQHLQLTHGVEEEKFDRSTFKIECTGDICCGDVVMFKQKIHSRYKSAEPLGDRIVAGRIIQESYGSAKAKRTYTIEVFWSNGYQALDPLSVLRIKGSTLYSGKVYRQERENESQSYKAHEEKCTEDRHTRKKAAKGAMAKEGPEVVGNDCPQDEVLNHQPRGTLPTNKMVSCANSKSGPVQEDTAGTPGTFVPYSSRCAAKAISEMQARDIGTQKYNPERPGQQECQCYMRTGDCNTCMHHHSKDRVTRSATCILSPMGLEGNNEPQSQKGLEEKHISEENGSGYKEARREARGPTTREGHVIVGTDSPQGDVLNDQLQVNKMGIQNPRKRKLEEVEKTENIPGMEDVGSTTSTRASKVTTGKKKQQPVSKSCANSKCGPGAQDASAPYQPGSAATYVPATQAQQYGIKKGNMYPERPGQQECKHYMKTGKCKFGANCRYHHPKDRITPLLHLHLGRKDESQSHRELEGRSTKEEIANGSCHTHKEARKEGKGATAARAGHGIESSDSPQEEVLNDEPQVVQYKTRKLKQEKEKEDIPSVKHVGPTTLKRAPKLTVNKKKKQTSSTKCPNLASESCANSKCGSVQEHITGGQIISTPYQSGFAAKTAAQYYGSQFPERPGQKECKRYMKTGDCKSGATCRYHHPKDRVMPLATYILNQMGLPLQLEREDKPQSMKGLEKNHTTEENASASRRRHKEARREAKVATAMEAMQAQQYGTQEYNMFPERPGQKECKRYMKTGECKVGATCRYHHPKDRVMPLAAYISSQMDQLVAGVPGSKPGPAATSIAAMQAQQYGTQEHMFPERPGTEECKHYLKTGDCKFRAICRYHHPKDRVIKSATCTSSPMGIPLQLERKSKPQSHQGLEEKHMEENTSGSCRRYKEARREAMAMEGPEIVDSDCLQEQLINNQTQGLPTKVAKGDQKSGKHKLKQKNGKGDISPVKILGPTKSVTGRQETPRSFSKKSKDRVTPLATCIASETGFPLQLEKKSKSQKALEERCATQGNASGSQRARKKARKRAQGASLKEGPVIVGGDSGLQEQVLNNHPQEMCSADKMTKEIRKRKMKQKDETENVLAVKNVGRKRRYFSQECSNLDAVQEHITTCLQAMQDQQYGTQRDSIVPERPGQQECQHYMPPLRLGAPQCTEYMQNGICKIGPTCKFDHPLATIAYTPSAEASYAVVAPRFCWSF